MLGRQGRICKIPLQSQKALHLQSLQACQERSSRPSAMLTLRPCQQQEAFGFCKGTLLMSINASRYAANAVPISCMQRHARHSRIVASRMRMSQRGNPRLRLHCQQALQAAEVTRDASEEDKASIQSFTGIQPGQS